MRRYQKPNDYHLNGQEIYQKSTSPMCFLVVKNNIDGKPLRAKSRIVILGNFDYILYQKSQR